MHLLNSHIILLSAFFTGLVGGGVHAQSDGKSVDPSKIRPGHWAELPNTDVSKVVPKETPSFKAWGVMGPRSIITAWGTASFDAEAMEIHINHQGGHADYGGNEDYRLKLFDGEGWIRWSDPSLLDANHIPIGTPRPRSTHGWGGAVWVPTLKAAFNTGRALFPSGDGQQAWLTYPDRGTYEKLSFPAPQPYYNPDSLHAVWDPNRKLVLNFRYNTEQFDPVTKKITALPKHSGNTESFWSGSASYDPDTQTGVFCGGGDTLIIVDARDLSRMRRSAYPAAKLSGTHPKLCRSGIDYVPRLKKFVLWPGGRETYLLDHKQAGGPVVTTFANAEGPEPPKSNTAGSVYGRWKYVPKYDLFWGLDWYPGNVFLWKVPREEGLSR